MNIGSAWEEKAMATHSSTLAWKIPWSRSLVGCSPWGHEESDTTERLHFHFSLSCIGEGNGGPLQCSCLENPRDRAAWWAAVYGVTQSRTRLKWLSSSNSAWEALPGNLYFNKPFRQFWCLLTLTTTTQTHLPLKQKHQVPLFLCEVILASLFVPSAHPECEILLSTSLN